MTCQSGTEKSERKETAMWYLEDDQSNAPIPSPRSLGDLAQHAMAKIIDAEAAASKRAMEIISLQADETEARLNADGLTQEQSELFVREQKEIRKDAMEQTNAAMGKSWQYLLLMAGMLIAAYGIKKAQ
jgi:hypothetical protein